MIVLFSGSHGTGKSTQVENLRKHDYFKNYKVADSISEKFFKREDFKHPEADAMVGLQNSFTDFQLGVFSGETLGHDVISSRSYADIWAYTKHLYKVNSDDRYLQQLDKIEKAAKLRGMVQYVYFPIMFKLEGKELRSTNQQFQYEIDDYIQEFFRKLGIAPYTVKQEGDQRYGEIFKHLTGKDL